MSSPRGYASLAAMRTIFLLAASTCLLAQLPAPNAAGVTTGHHHMTVVDPAVHKKIWTEVFAAQVLAETPRLQIKLPGIFLFFDKGTPSGGSENSAVDHFAFGVKDLDGTRDKLKAAGVEIVREINGAQREIVAMFPDKIKIEFYADATLAIPVTHHHIHFSTADPDGLREWYVKVFGAEVTRNGNAVSTRIPGTGLSFRKVDQPAPKTQGRSLDHIGFDVRDVAAFCQKLATMSITCDKPVPDRPLAFIVDPAGSRIEINQGLASR
jgi:catechol 2,3-dioxygenase-like lactoylglutathione lyase family enzyme/predicted enzyme related to lactoylglutathione lyase